MWFKNLQVYRFTRPFELTDEQLENQLEACAFTPCGSQDISRFGWTRPFGKLGHTLIHAANGQLVYRSTVATTPGTLMRVHPCLVLGIHSLTLEQNGHQVTMKLLVP